MNKFTKKTALILCHELFKDPHGKTAHGLIRGTQRYDIVGVIDPTCAGKDAGEQLDGVIRNIPVFSSIKESLNKLDKKPECAIIGAAFEGGQLPKDWEPIVTEVLTFGINLVSGLHQFLSEDQNFKKIAEEKGIGIEDIRRPPSSNELHFWTGNILSSNTPKVAVLGMDCALGKRTTTQLLTQSCQRNSIESEMIYTGQTGWLQGHRYGFILDSTPNDFVCGELEHAILLCEKEMSPDIMLIEGQSSLRNPSGPCGAEYLLSGNIKHVIYQYAPFQTFFDGFENFNCRLPTLEQDLELINQYGASVVGLTLNGRFGSSEELVQVQKALSSRYDFPVVRPIEEGVDALLPVLRSLISNKC